MSYSGLTPKYLRVTLKGTAGGGYLEALQQSAAPGAPASGFRFYANAAANPAVQKVGSSFSWSIIVPTLTANRTFSVPDYNFSFPTAAPSAAGEALTWNGTNYVWSPAGITGTGTANRLTYWSSSTALAAAASIYVDAVNNRLGVGSTSAPAQDILAQKTITAADGVIIRSQNDEAGATSVAQMQVAAANATAVGFLRSIKAGGTTRIEMGSAGAQDVYLMHGGTEQIRVTNGELQVRTAKTFRLLDSANTGSFSITAPTTVTTSSNLTAPTTAPTANSVLKSTSGGVLSWDNPLFLSGGTMTGFLTLNADPSTSLQAATKQYVDAMAGGVQLKAGVRVATTANIASLSGLLTVDGVTVSALDRVLVKNQSTLTENGIYVAGAGAWSRSVDMDTGTEFAQALVTVGEGTANANTGWYQTTENVIVGVSNVVFIQFFGAGTYTADGTTLTLTGSTFSIATGGVSNAQVNNSAAIALSKLAALTANSAVVTSSGGVLTTSATSSAQIGFLSGVTSDVQAQLSGKIGGTGAANQVAVFDSGSSVAGTSALTYSSGNLTNTNASGSSFLSLTPGIAASRSQITMRNSDSLTFNIRHLGTGDTGSLGTAGAVEMVGNPGAQISFGATSAQPIVFFINSAEVARWNTNDQYVARAGTAALPSIAITGSLGTGMWSPAANTMAWSTAGVERMRLLSTGYLTVGSNLTTPTAAGFVAGRIQTLGDSQNDGRIAMSVAVDNAGGTTLRGYKSRGTHAAPTAVQAGDTMLGLLGYGYEANATPSFVNATEYYHTVESISGDIVAGVHRWTTANGAGTLAERMRLTSAGNLVIAATTAGAGYTLPGPSRSLTIAGEGSANTTSRGILALVNNRPTASINSDIAGEILFLSQNNGSAPSDGSRLVADIATRLTGSGGVNGFGGQLELYVKADNATALTLAHTFLSDGTSRSANGIFMDDDAANGGATALNYYREATHATTFTSNGTGGGTTGSQTLRITRVGRVVTIYIPTFDVASGTGASAINSNTALPSWAFPNATANTVNQNYSTTVTPTTETLWTRVNTGGTFIFDVRNGGTHFNDGTTARVHDQYITYTV